MNLTGKMQINFEDVIIQSEHCLYGSGRQPFTTEEPFEPDFHKKEKSESRKKIVFWQICMTSPIKSGCFLKKKRPSPLISDKQPNFKAKEPQL